MKFLIDECLGYSLSHWLKEKKYDVVSVCDALKGAKDSDVLKKAYDEKRILVTSDKDFGEMIFRQQRAHCGIILLRLIHETPENKIFTMQTILQLHGDELEGNFIVANESAIKIIRQAIN